MGNKIRVKVISSRILAWLNHWMPVEHRAGLRMSSEFRNIVPCRWFRSSCIETREVQSFRCAEHACSMDNIQTLRPRI